MWPVSRDSLDHCAGRAVSDDARLARFLVVDDADHADLDDVAERVGLLHQFWRRRQRRPRLPSRSKDEDDRIAGAAGHQALHVGE